jgi:hypothetical protein
LLVSLPISVTPRSCCPSAASSWQISARWAASLLLAGIAAAGLRWLFYIGPPVVASALRVPSGHTAGSALVYGGLALMIARAGSPREGAAAIAASVLLVGAIALTRIYLPNTHSVAEVIVGLAIGLGCLAWFARADLNIAYPGAMTAVVIALALLLHGHRFAVWPLLRTLALQVQSVVSRSG